jgi:hypothetical protein
MRDLPQIIDYDKDQLAYALANALKERDEANKELHKQLVQFDHLFDEAEKIRIERDEARDIVEKLSKQGLDIMDENKSLKRERDEAREQNAKLREIAESAVWRMENGVCLPDASAVRAIKEEGLRLRAELDQLKEGTK